MEERLRTLEQELAACAASDDYGEAVGLLRCFRGVDTVTAMTVLAELGDVTRFGSARQLMSYRGLTPSEYSSGARAGPWCWPTARRPGSIAATGGWPITASRRSWRTRDVVQKRASHRDPGS